MMERPRSLKPWGDSPKHSGPTWRTAIGLLVLAAVLSLLLEGWWILSVPETLRATSRVVRFRRTRAWWRWPRSSTTRA